MTDLYRQGYEHGKLARMLFRTARVPTDPSGDDYQRGWDAGVQDAIKDEDQEPPVPSSNDWPQCPYCKGYHPKDAIWCPGAY